MERKGAEKGPEHAPCRVFDVVGDDSFCIAAYVRVSSRSQDAAYQRAAIERAASARGERVGRWFSDVASGRSMERPELARALEEIRGGCIRRLWVWRLDRLTRSGIVDTLTAIETMRAHGCECASVADGFALDGPAAPVVLAVLAWAAQMERQKIAENQAAARQRMASEGRSWGRPRLVTPELLARLRELRELGWTHRSIAKELKLSRSHVGALCRQTESQAAAENTPLQNGERVR